MFHKILCTDLPGIKLLVLAICILLTSGMALAQQPTSTQPENPQQEGRTPSADQDNPEAVQPIEVPIKTLAPQTFVDDVFQSRRNHWGFTISGYGAYSTDISPNPGTREDSTIAAVIPRVFFNWGKKKSLFHMDVGAGYRHYYHQSGLSNWDYYGEADYIYNISKRASVQVNDQFTSSYNDSWSFISLYSPLPYDNRSSSSEVLFNRQRITRNALNGDFNFQLTRKARIGVQGGYNDYVYNQASLADSRASYVGGDFGYRFTKWLDFTARYSHYFNYSDNPNNDTQINQLRIGTFDFQLSHGWKLWFGGGLDYANYQNDTHLTQSIDAGVGYTAKDFAFNVRYNRGFTSAIGISRLMITDNVNAEFSYRITNRMRASLQSYYYRSTEQYFGGVLKTFAGGGGFEFALRQDLFLSLSSFFQNQRGSDVAAYQLGLNRLTAYAGIQYVWPRRKRSDYESAPTAGPTVQGRSW